MDSKKISIIILAIVGVAIAGIIGAVIIASISSNKTLEKSDYNVEDLISQSTDAASKNQNEGDKAIQIEVEEVGKLGIYEYDGSYQYENGKYSFDSKGILPLGFKLSLITYEDGTIDVIPWYEDFADLGSYKGTYTFDTNSFSVSLTKYISTENEEIAVNEKYEFEPVQDSNDIRVKTDIMNVKEGSILKFTPEE